MAHTTILRRVQHYNPESEKRWNRYMRGLWVLLAVRRNIHKGSNLIEQDHRRVKHRISPMLGFKRFDNAVITISGIELAETIKKGQFKTGKLRGPNVSPPEMWRAALAA